MKARRRTAHLKDEVYRQMFRLEERRSGAEMGLAIAWLRAWLAADSKPEWGNWLQKVSKVCVEMIEASLQENGTALPRALGPSR